MPDREFSTMFFLQKSKGKVTVPLDATFIAGMLDIIERKSDLKMKRVGWKGNYLVEDVQMDWKDYNEVQRAIKDGEV